MSRFGVHAICMYVRHENSPETIGCLKKRHFCRLMNADKRSSPNIFSQIVNVIYLNFQCLILRILMFYRSSLLITIALDVVGWYLWGPRKTNTHIVLLRPDERMWVYVCAAERRAIVCVCACVRAFGRGIRAPTSVSLIITQYWWAYNSAGL